MSAPRGGDSGGATAGDHGAGPGRGVERAPLRAPILVVLVLLAGAALTAGSFFLLRAQEESHAQLDFMTEAQERFAALEGQVDHSLVVLDSLAALFLASEVVEREEFGAFAAQHRAAHPEIRALEWIPVVPGDERAAYEAGARAEGLEDFSFTELDPAGTLVRAADRAEYHPAYFVEPLEGNRAAVGFDLASEPTRRDTLYRSRDEGIVLATPALRLVQDEARSASLLIVRPVYRSGIRPPTLASRRADLAGHVLGVFTVADLVGSAPRPGEAGLVDVCVFAEAQDGPVELLHYEDARAGDDGGVLTLAEAETRLASAPQTAEIEMDVAGRVWRVVALPADGVSFVHRTWQPWLVLLGGLIATAALAGYVRLLQVRGLWERRHAEAIRESKERLEREVREREAVEEQLRESQRLEAIGRLAGGVAHDFNNLLTAILGGVGLLRTATPGSDSWHGDLGQIQRAAESAAGLTRQLLAFSRSQVLKPERHDLNLVVAELEGVIDRVTGPRVHLDLRLARGPLPLVADRAQIEQVLLNLVVNARDAMPNGGRLLIATRQEPPASPDAPAQIVLSVTDTGVGIPPEAIPRIFEPFFTTKGSEEGVGLGLATVYGIVSQSGGTIKVESVVGEGTTFHVRLPRAPVSRVPRSPDDAETPTAAPVPASVDGPGPGDGPAGAARSGDGPAGGARAGGGQAEDAAGGARAGAHAGATILLVEDEPTVLRLAARALRRHGYEVLTAHSGMEALETAASHDGAIDLLLTDVMMPGMNGKELATHLVRARPRTPVLYVSGYAADVIAPEDVADSTARFLAKPFTPDTLAAEVADILRGT